MIFATATQCGEQLMMPNIQDSAQNGARFNVPVALPLAGSRSWLPIATRPRTTGRTQGRADDNEGFVRQAERGNLPCPSNMKAGLSAHFRGAFPRGELTHDHGIKKELPTPPLSSGVRRSPLLPDRKLPESKAHWGEQRRSGGLKCAPLRDHSNAALGIGRRFQAYPRRIGKPWGKSFSQVNAR